MYFAVDLKSYKLKLYNAANAVTICKLTNNDSAATARVRFPLVTSAFEVEAFTADWQAILDVTTSLEDEYLTAVPTLSRSCGVVVLSFVVVEKFLINLMLHGKAFHCGRPDEVWSAMRFKGRWGLRSEDEIEGERWLSSKKQSMEKSRQTKQLIQLIMKFRFR